MGRPITSRTAHALLFTTCLGNARRTWPKKVEQVDGVLVRHNLVMADSEGQDRGNSPLLETKLFAPKLRSSVVPRPRLIERLNTGVERKLTLISAPAGFGKTTLISEWLSSSSNVKRPSSWLSLDERDNDPALFWAYFVAALQRIDAHIGENLLPSLRTQNRSSIESALTMLINEISGIDRDFTVILDDYHSIDTEPIHEAVAFLIEHLPQQMHLILVSRGDPGLALGRMRGRGELNELRAADLRFTSSEAAVFLSDVMGLQLSADDLAGLESRTEGWIAGLQLAALSMQGRDDVSGFIETFAGHNRYIVDYLAEEVLQLQDENVRNFLLRTSILDRLDGSLCDAVTGIQDGSKVLVKLERGNFFVIPLDDRREWYRYHHLFSDVLRSRLEEENPELVPALHERASTWFEQHGHLPDAIRHALAAENFEKAADLIDLAWRDALRSNEEATWLGWLKSLPESAVRVRPVLVMAHAWILLFSGEFEAGEARIREAEKLLRMADSSESANQVKVADKAGFSVIPATIASARSFYSQGVGDSASAFSYAERALELLPEDSHFDRVIPSVTVGLAQLQNGDLDAAYDSMVHSIEQIRKSGDELAALSGTMVLAEIRMAQGRVREAIARYREAIRAFDSLSGPLQRGKADLHLGLTEAVLEQGDIESARRYFAASEALGEQAMWEAYESRSLLVRGKIKEFEGDLKGALEMYEAAERVSTPSVMPDIRPIPAMKARIWMRQGRVVEAVAWLRTQDLSIDDELTFLREFEHTTLAMILIERFKSEDKEQLLLDASQLLNRLLNAAVEGGRNGPLIDILVQLALAESARGEFDRAIEPLERALTLGEPEGYARVFLAGGDEMRSLLQEVSDASPSAAYAKRLLSMCEEEAGSKPAQPTAPAPPLPEALTVREVEVMRQVAAGLTNQEIADQLFISLPTVKRHIANIYSKLGSNHRTQAVKTAHELNLL